jgi:hypothetical protein
MIEDQLRGVTDPEIPGFNHSIKILTDALAVQALQFAKCAPCNA